MPGRDGRGAVTGARTVVVGASHWHVPLYAQAIEEVHHVVGLSDEDPATVTSLAEQWEAPVDADWRRLLDLPRVELAYVFGPHDRMVEVCLALIERRIPFVVEKPLGTSLEQLQRVRNAADEAHVPATVPLVQRGGPVNGWLAKAGKPIYQRLSFLAGPPERITATATRGCSTLTAPAAARWPTWVRTSSTCSFEAAATRPPPSRRDCRPSCTPGRSMTTRP